jgi:hypothetical protein
MDPERDQEGNAVISRYSRDVDHSWAAERGDAVRMVAARPGRASAPRTGVWNQPRGSRSDGPSMRIVVH